MNRIGIGAAVCTALTIALVACSSVDGGNHAPDCKAHPNAAACQKGNAAAPAASTGASLLPAVDAAVPVPPVLRPDAGPDGSVVGPKPPIPQPNVACRDLLACCNKVRDTIERAACVAVGYKAESSTCANAIIAYQVFGGCGHTSLGLPDIFNSNGSENTSKDCTYLERACMSDPTQCSAAYQCDGVPVGGTSTTPQTETDSCTYASDTYCCQYPKSYDCGGNPTYDPCETATDKFCCRYPQDTCCLYPNNAECTGTPTYTPPPEEPPPPQDPPPPEDPPYDPCDYYDCGY